MYDVLQELDGSGDFSCGGEFIDEVAPELDIQGLGRLQLPLTPQQAEQLRSVAAAAPFGRGSATVVDQSVRRCWQLEPAQIAVSNSLQWSHAVWRAAQQAAEGLGLPPMQLQALLYKCLLYTEGDFFLPHRDTEKAPGMVATLTITLPSQYEGGELVVTHNGVTRTYGGRPTAHPTYAAFYADCQHEVKPLASGARLALVYNLVHVGQGPTPAPPDNSATVATLRSAVQRWQADERGPSKLLLMLDHHYTEAGIKAGLAALKGKDRASALVLQRLEAEGLLDVHLALATKHQTGAAEEEGYDWRYGRCKYGRNKRIRWCHDEDEESEEEEEEMEEETTHTMLEVFDEERQLCHFCTLGGSKRGFDDMQFKEDTEMLPADFFEDRDPDEEDYEGYTGNAGAQLERWYRHAALVIWPRALRFQVLSTQGIRSAVCQLAASVAEGEPADSTTAFASAILDHFTSRQPASAYDRVMGLCSVGDVSMHKVLLSCLSRMVRAESQAGEGVEAPPGSGPAVASSHIEPSASAPPPAGNSAATAAPITAVASSVELTALTPLTAGDGFAAAAPITAEASSVESTASAPPPASSAAATAAPVTAASLAHRYLSQVLPAHSAIGQHGPGVAQLCGVLGWRRAAPSLRAMVAACDARGGHALDQPMKLLRALAEGVAARRAADLPAATAGQHSTQEHATKEGQHSTKEGQHVTKQEEEEACIADLCRLAAEAVLKVLPHDKPGQPQGLHAMYLLSRATPPTLALDALAALSALGVLEQLPLVQALLWHVVAGFDKHSVDTLLHTRRRFGWEAVRPAVEQLVQASAAPGGSAQLPPAMSVLRRLVDMAQADVQAPAAAGAATIGKENSAPFGQDGAADAAKAGPFAAAAGAAKTGPSAAVAGAAKAGPSAAAADAAKARPFAAAADAANAEPSPAAVDAAKAGPSAAVPATQRDQLAALLTTQISAAVQEGELGQNEAPRGPGFVVDMLAAAHALQTDHLLLVDTSVLATAGESLQHVLRQLTVRLEVCPRRYPLAGCLAEACMKLHSLLGAAKAEGYPALQHLTRSTALRLQHQAGLLLQPQADWRLDCSLGCTCRMCSAAQAFLLSPTLQTQRFPLNKKDRQHLHQKLDARASGLVTHVTHRVGCPYSLVLTKTELHWKKRQQQGQLMADLSSKLLQLLRAPPPGYNLSNPATATGPPAEGPALPAAAAAAAAARLTVGAPGIAQPAGGQQSLPPAARPAVQVIDLTPCVARPRVARPAATEVIDLT